jgi:hypothetical protein
MSGPRRRSRSLPRALASRRSRRLARTSTNSWMTSTVVVASTLPSAMAAMSARHGSLSGCSFEGALAPRRQAPVREAGQAAVPGQVRATDHLTCGSRTTATPGPLEALTARLDAEAETAVVRRSRILTAAEARASLESLPGLWATTSAAGRHPIAVTEFVLPPVAIRGWSSAVPSLGAFPRRERLPGAAGGDAATGWPQALPAAAGGHPR